LPAFWNLKNGVPVYLLEEGTQPVVKIDFVFRAGRPFEKHKLASQVCAGLLKEGTKTKTSKEIAEKIDYYGAGINIPYSFDYIQITLYSLQKHIHALLPLLAEIISQPAFSDNEFAQLVTRSCRKLEIDLAQNDVQAYRFATELFFGPDHPYGYNSSEALYKKITPDHVRSHYESLFGAGNMSIFVSGRPSSENLDLLNTIFGSWDKYIKIEEPHLTTWTSEVQPYHLRGKNQKSAIRIGRKMFNRNHPDFGNFFVLNTLLGGYFGSRLMQNIREEKGLTYHIQSSIESLQYDGYFSIALETDRAKTKVVLAEIWKEIEKLKTDLVTEEELTMVRSYLSGYLLSMLDGPFQKMDVIKTGILETNDPSYLQKFFTQINSTTAEEIRSMANTYLNKETLYQVIVD
jgi:predicted Zn-dependent peptidase